MLRCTRLARSGLGARETTGFNAMKMTKVSNESGATVPDVGKDMNADQLALLCADLREQNAQMADRIRHLEEEICRDTLTPLYNRRHFEDAVATSIAHCQRYDSRMALLFVDVDDLKAINDTYGHAAGDEALCCIANVLLANVRNTDVVARIGGDEFALLLGAISEQDVAAKIGQLTVGIAACRPQFSGKPGILSATFGHAFISPDDQAAQVLARADQIMYQSKRARRTAC